MRRLRPPLYGNTLAGGLAMQGRYHVTEPVEEQLSVDELYALVDSFSNDIVTLEMALIKIKALCSKGYVREDIVLRIIEEALDDIDIIELEFDLDE